MSFIFIENGVEWISPILCSASYRKNFDGEPTSKGNQWKDKDMAGLFLEKAKSFMQEDKDKLFFLDYGLH